MKKWIAYLLVFVMVCSFAACGINTAGEQNTENVLVTETEEPIIITDANEILTKAWEQYQINAGEDFQFPIIGGHVASNVLDKPAKFDMNLEGAANALRVAYALTEENTQKLDDIATMMNLMRAYNFTASSVHVLEGSNMQEIIAGIELTLSQTQWMGGVPEQYLIVTINDEYIVTAYGNEQIVELFRRAIVKVYEDAVELVAQKPIAK